MFNNYLERWKVVVIFVRQRRKADGSYRSLTGPAGANIRNPKETPMSNQEV